MSGPPAGWAAPGETPAGLGRIAIGFDVGTSSVKATALTESGRVFTASSAPYPTAIPFEGAVEQDPDHWWAAVVEAARLLLGELVQAGAQIGPVSTVIGLTGQMHTSVLLGEYGEIVHPALLWSDKRAVAECRELLEAVPAFVEITGNTPMPAFTVAHLMWLRRHRPETFARVRQVLNPKDDIRRRLGAGLSTEPADASATGLFDTRTGEWSSAVAAAAGIDPAILPPVLASHEVSGAVTTTGALGDDDVLRLLTGVPVVGGGGDQATQAVALGVTAPGLLGLSLGTSGVAFAGVAAPQPGAFRHSYDRLWLALDSTHAAGLSLTWLAGITRSPVAELTATAAGPHDSPLFLPYLQGHRDAAGGGAPGAFVGLDAHHTSEHLAYAAMEGVAFELARLGTTIGGLPDRVSPAPTASGSSSFDTEVHLGGGGGRSALWRSILATVLGRTVVFTDRDSSFGAALIAAESAGWSAAFAAADSALRQVTEPDAALAALTRERHARFAALTEALSAV